MKCLLFIILLIATTSSNAQTRKELRRQRAHQMRVHVDSVLDLRRSHINYDTAYISRPDCKLTLKTRMNLSGNSIHTKGTTDGVRSKSDLSTDDKLTLSIGANYKGIGTGLAINPASLSGKKKDYEINVNFYSTRFSVDASYQDSKTLSGDIYYNGKNHVDPGTLNMRVLNLAAYYTFNYRRFSYPAAFTQSYIQKKSAGSLLAGISFQGGRIKTSKDAPDTYTDIKLEADHFGVGMGYGYNFVLGKKWLFHLSALPTFVIFNHNNLTLDGERIKAKTVKVNMIFNERLAIVHQFSPRYFAGMTLVANNSWFDDDIVIISQQKWRTRLFFGMRL